MRPDRFTQQVALITGGASGIALCTARIMAAEGARLAIVDKDIGGGQAAVAELRGLGAEALFVEADLSRPELVSGVVKQVLAHFSQVNILVNNAGSGRPGGTLVDQDEADWDWTFNLCLKSPCTCWFWMACM
jgi:NAD(P)-dependent dehydrogenase (short-subunit alcohol dehydrogenase family)